jgi:transcriptional regulator with XRE-family HTH domain
VAKAFVCRVAVFSLEESAPVSPQERFAANLRRARSLAGISQEELGYRCDLHRTEVSLLERSGREPRMATIVKLAGALGTTPAELCAGISWLPRAGRFEVKRPPRA